MVVGLRVDYLWHPIGTGDFVHSFFSTICYNLENNCWGSKYPYLMNYLYQGELNYKDADNALNELAEIKKIFKELEVDKVVWDIDDLGKRPPWGDEISEEITDLSNYFVTCEGEDLFDEIINALEESKAEKIDIILEYI